MAYDSGSVLVRAIMSAQSGLVADQVVNDFAFQLPTPALAADFTFLFGAVEDFYNDVQASGFSVGSFISNQINRAATHELQATIITTPPLGSPAASIPWIGPVIASSGFGHPTECAGVLSFHGDLTGIPEEAGATRPRARRRGRVYIGPLSREAVDVGSPPYMLSADFNTTLRQAAVALRDVANLQYGSDVWAVWSRAAQTLYPIVGGWTDNAPDTQRRRGPDPTARVTWS